MNLFADEGLERVIVARLRSDGHHVVWVAELAPSIPDEEVLRQAHASGTILLTEDKDFGELVYRRRLSHSGVLLIRLEGLDNLTKADLISKVIRDHEDELIGAFSVITSDHLRIRRPPISPTLIP